MKKNKLASAVKTGCVLLLAAGIAHVFLACGSQPGQETSFKGAGPVARFEFNGSIDNAAETSVKGKMEGKASFGEGLEGESLRISAEGPRAFLTLDSRDLPFDPGKDFSVQCWIRTSMDAGKTYAVLSQKSFFDKSLSTQKKAGWALYSHGGTWAWNMGSGTRRITHENDNGTHMPLNDGKWHQLTMTYSRDTSMLRLFYDGANKALYNLRDSEGFDFSSAHPLVAGWNGSNEKPQPEILPQIESGAEKLQELVDAFNRLGLKKVEPEEFVSLIVGPERLWDRKVAAMKEEAGAGLPKFSESKKTEALEPVQKIRDELMKNPYTVHQVKDFMDVAPLLKVYSLVGDKVTIRQNAARIFTEGEKLSRPDFDMDKLAIWDRALSPEEVLNSYSEYFEPDVPDLEKKLTSITAGDWNIHHGGIHNSMDKDGWDSRMRIAEMLRKENADVIMMQETYSHGDYISAELGYYFATTVDRDYLNQGANISVLSRYPIKEIYVQGDSAFMNVAVKIAISKTQDLYVMSNWYGMKQFPAVFDFHQARFQESDSIPTLLAGDFNAVPHTDGGKSPASRKLLEAGFSDAYRSLYPDVQKYPGPTHHRGSRIDQLYYKGRGLKNISTKVISDWPTGYPSDHFLIISKFDLNYSTVKKEKKQDKPN